MRITARAICVSLLLSVVVFPLCAGVAGDVWSLKTASTEHFDIIFSDSNRETASLLYDNCENIYGSLVEYFGSDPGLHIPVVVTSLYKELNAYYTSYPANRIVIFDTVPSQGMLSNYPQTILYVFRHELTHAFQSNFRGPFMNAMSKVFGDVLSLGTFFYLYPSLSEGGAVVSESLDGYGRLNSSYAMQIVKQAKLEGLFPNWFEIAGARDTYPSGLLYYNFAAAFLEYLSITYGYDTISDVYVRFKWLKWLSTPGQVIEDKIGKSVSEAWQDFYDWVEVPENVTVATPVESLTRAGRFATPVLAADGRIYIYDSSTWSVLRFEKDLSSCTSVLRLPTDEQNLSLSSDGNFLLIPFVSDEKASVRLYNVASGSQSAQLVHEFSSADRDYRGGCFVRLDFEDFVLLYGNNGQDTYLDLYTLDDFTPVRGKSLEHGYGVTASDFACLPDGNAAFILNYQSHDNIALLDVRDMSLRLLDNPDDLKFMSLTAGKDGRVDVLSFSWYPADAKAVNLGRYGEIYIASDGSYEMRLSSTDVLGSMKGCLRTGDAVLFPVQYYERSDIRTIRVSDMEFGEPVRLGATAHEVPGSPDTAALAAATKDYHAIKYFFDGVLLPYSSVVFSDDTLFKNNALIALGATWLTVDPTETHTHQISAGYGFGNIIGSYTFVSTNFAIPYSIGLSAAYGTSDEKTELSLGKGELRASAEVQASWSTELRNGGETVGISDDYVFTMQKTPDSDFSFSHLNTAVLSYSCGFKTGTNPYDAFKFTTSAYLLNLNPGIKLTFSFPRLLWWRCDGPDVTNLPFSAGIDVTMVRGMNLLIAGAATVVLYSREIQWSPSFMGLYFQRFVLGSSYEIQYSTLSNSLKSHTLSMSAVFYMSPIVGTLLTRLKIGLGASVQKDLSVGWGDGWKFSIAFGL
jgi:hypothetical protein